MNKGVLYAAGAFFLWGILPIYLKAIKAASPMQILGHRIVWSVLLLVLIIAWRKEWKIMRQILRSKRTLLVLFIAALLLGVNWLTYIWAVNSGHVVESSLGYFINPLVSVLLGVIILHERLRPLQWIPVGLATLGVAYLTWRFGSLPWIALVLAFTFGLYGLIKKTAAVEALYGLLVETAILGIPALGYLLFVEFQGTGAFGHGGLVLTLLLSFAGLVTTIPLLLFASGARLIPLSTLGIIQFIAPTGQFLLGVLVFHESFSVDSLIGFSLIWLALIIFSLESYQAHKRANHTLNIPASAGTP